MPGSKQCDGSDGSVRSIRVGDLEPVALLEVLNDVRAFIKRFCVFPNEHCLNAVSLWAVHAHIVEHLYTTARLAVISPELASGKTRVLEILNLLVPLPEFSFSASAASIFRLLAQDQITLLFDEVDTIWSKRGKDDSYEDLRALLNAGYKRGATIPRCTGKNHEVVRFKVYCAVAMAGIGNLPETIMSRSVIINMRRRTPDEKIEPFYWRTHEPEGHKLRNRLTEWAESVGVEIGNHVPVMPEDIVDRPAEVWEPLLTVADYAGGQWPASARDACKVLCKAALDTRTSLGVRLLTDLKKVFGSDTQLPTKTVLQRLYELEEAPWDDLYGKKLTTRRLAGYLRPYGIKSGTIRLADGSTPKGYKTESLYDAWVRYTPAEAPQAPQAPQVNGGAGSSVADKSVVADSNATIGNGKNGEPSDASEGNTGECGGKQTPHATNTPHSNLDSVRDVADVADVADLRTHIRDREKLTI